jgi:hypothetical protein
MLKTLFVLLLGIVIGYAYGFNDAKKNEHSILARAVGKVGGASRDKVKNDLDARADSIEARR